MILDFVLRPYTSLPRYQLSRQLDTLKQECGGFKSALAVAHEARADMLAQLRALEKSAHTAETSLSRAEQERARVEARHDSATRELKVLAQRKTREESEVEELRVTQHTLASRLRATQQALDEARGIASEAVSQRDAAAEELASTKRALQRLQRECDRLSLGLAASEQSTRELEGSGSQLEEALRRCRDECDALRDELRKSAQRARAVDEENGNLRALVRAGEEARRVWEDGERPTLLEEVARKERARQLSVTQADQSRRACDKARDEAERVGAALRRADQARDECQTALDASAERVFALQAEIAKSEERETTTNARWEEVAKAKKGVEQALAQRSEEAARMRAQLTRMADACTDKDAQLQLCRGELETLRRDLRVSAQNPFFSFFSFFFFRVAGHSFFFCSLGNNLTRLCFLDYEP